MIREIQVLDETTIDKIAAGEVVERPASVVKELTENALDALATAITVEIRDGGTTFIRITDNGAGIPAGQVRTAFLRHATSKIRKVEDLDDIASLGFRGEALSSIASVSRMECITKTPDALTGIRYTIEGGKEKECEEIGAPQGTTFIVRDLFYNVPARAKFLKSPQAEGSQCASWIEELALSHPEVSFKFIMNGQNRLYTSGNGDLKEIVYQIYGRDLTKELIPVDTASEIMHIHGFIANPNASRGNRNFENYFINNRFVKNNVITKAIEDGYHGFLMQHRYPFTLLYLDIDSHKVDVNVHPRKLEVRLSDQERLYHELCLAIQNALMNRERIPEVSTDKEVRPRGDKGVRLPFLKGGAPEPFERTRKTSTTVGQIGAEKSSESPERMDAGRKAMPGGQDDRLRDSVPVYGGVSSTERADTLHTDVSTAETTSNKPDADAAKTFTTSVSDINDELETVTSNSAVEHIDSSASSDKQMESQPDRLSEVEGSGQENNMQAGRTTDGRTENVFSGQENNVRISQTTDNLPEAIGSGQDKTVRTEQMNMFREDKVLSEQARRQFRLIGQLFDTYWLIEYKDSLYIIDQHAAHEKVNYERMMRGYREKKISSQMLYPPVILNLSAHETELISRHMESFTDLGFELEPFGVNAYRLNAVPANLYVKPEDLFTEILGQLDSMGEGDPAVITEKIASMACKASVKGNMKISEKEAEALIDELLTLENPYNCPHGRPTIISISRYEMDKKFRRIVS